MIKMEADDESENGSEDESEDEVEIYFFNGLR